MNIVTYESKFTGNWSTVCHISCQGINITVLTVINNNNEYIKTLKVQNNYSTMATSLLTNGNVLAKLTMDGKE